MESFAASGSCEYINDSYYYGYSCQLKVENLTNEDEISNISGNHSDFRDDDAVETVQGYLVPIPVIPTILCRQFKNLKKIIFTSGGFETITENSFSECKNLQTLTLFSYALRNISNHALANNKNLEEFHIWASQLAHIDESLFKGLQKLREVTLSNNLLLTIPDGLFDETPRVETLSLAWNQLTEISGSILSLKHLKSLNIDDNRVQRVTAETLGSFPDLASLRMSGNQLEKLDDDTFEPVKKLQALFVEFCGLEVINDKLFAPLTELTSLWMSYNNFEFIHPNAFKSLTKLQSLNLGGNNLEVLRPEWFESLSALQSLLLYSCRLKSISEEVFKFLPNLDSLSLERNSITEIPRNAFAHFKQVYFVYMADNKVKSLNSNIFASSNQTLGGIELARNQIEAVDPLIFDVVKLQMGFSFFNMIGNICVDQNFQNVPIEDLPPYFEACIEKFNEENSLPAKVCNYSHHPTYGYTCELSNVTFISELDEFKITGQHLPGKTNFNVEGVVFTSSTLSKVPRLVFLTFKNLKFLNIKGTKLATIDETTFESCGNLTWLDASDNLVEVLSSKAFSSCRNLETILLDNNYISQVEPCESFLTTLQLKRLSIKWNICINESFDRFQLASINIGNTLKKFGVCFSMWFI